METNITAVDFISHVKSQKVSLSEVTESNSAKFSDIIEHYDDVGILVNNAAVTICKSFHQMDPQEIDAVIDVNIRSTSHLTKSAIEHMLGKPHRGGIVNIGCADK